MRYAVAAIGVLLMVAEILQDRPDRGVFALAVLVFLAGLAIHYRTEPECLRREGR